MNSAIIIYVTNQFKIHEKYPTFQQQQKMNYRILFAGTGISKLIFLSFRLKHFVEWCVLGKHCLLDCFLPAQGLWLSDNAPTYPHHISSNPTAGLHSPQNVWLLHWSHAGLNWFKQAYRFHKQIFDKTQSA